MVGWYEVLESCANRLFHPIHLCTTIDVKGLQPQRTAVIFDSRGRQVVQDDEPEGEHSVAGGGTLAWIQVLPRGSSIRGRWNCDAKVLRGLQQEGFGGGYDGRHADEEAAEYEKDGSFEKVDGS